MKSRVLRYLVAAYSPALLLPVVDLALSKAFPLATWLFMIAWSIYVLILLVIYYASESRRG